MKVAVFSAKPYDVEHLNNANANSAVKGEHEFTFLEPHLNQQTVALAQGYDAICGFVNDTIDEGVVEKLSSYGIKLIAMRCAGFNNVDLDACEKHGLTVARVPEYSPYAVAEHAAALILDLNRNIHRAFARIRENDYSLNGLMGFDLHNKTISVVGGGKIGQTLIKIMKGFGCRVLCYDPMPSDIITELGAELVSLDTVWTESDIISLHCPLVRSTYHIINSNTISQMKRGVMLINTSRGGLIDTPAVITALKNGKVGYLGLDVYEEEAELFFEDYSNQVLQDDVFARLTTFNNVVITGHQAFFTREALQAIAEVTVQNISCFCSGDFESICLVTSH
ncbi:2-hydroxyacid dehydrogenase [Teredinibacter waterburyi]|jgi:Lactate dehydrogenase and related dehydrogenases|uniref:2-hydroxyacid dehydrogenase n=1 Tax=Teredinibacter waterburyi TaxID=1500538 RepID=UPI00165F15E1|nr:2-hydroxyacid dehydrogenase [Teredinibacter waterburyi]